MAVRQLGGQWDSWAGSGTVGRAVGQLGGSETVGQAVGQLGG